MNNHSLNHACSLGVFPRWMSWLLVCLGAAVSVRAEELAAAVAAKKVSVSFSGTGGSSGDSVTATVKLLDKNADPLDLTIAPGTRLRSGNSSDQNMVVAGVKGEMMGGQSYRGSSTIIARSTPSTYVLDAYCAEFEKDNPGPSTHFSVGSVDPVLACILEGALSLSVQARQAAVWIYTDKATYSHVNQKFSVSRSDWDAAAAVVRNCLSRPKGSLPESSAHPGPAVSGHTSSAQPDTTSLPSDLEIATQSATPGKRFKVDARGRVFVDGETPSASRTTQPAPGATPPAPGATPPASSTTPSVSDASAGTRPVKLRIDASGHRIVDAAAQAPTAPATPPAAEASTGTRPVRLRIGGDGRPIVDAAAQPTAAPVTAPAAESAAGTAPSSRPGRLRINANGHRIVDGAAQAAAPPVTAPEKAPSASPPVVSDSSSTSPDASAAAKTPAPIPAAPPAPKESSDETAWKQTDKVSDESLQKYLSQFPEGARSKDARNFLALSKQLQSIAAGTAKADVIIPFEALGKQWHVGGAKEGIAFSYNRTEQKGAMTGAFWRTPSLDYEGLRSGARGSFSDQHFSRWPESAPTGNGSIVAFDTQGEECPLRTSPVIVSDKGSIVYFGVVEKIGLVHLSGKGRVIFTDGTTKNLE